MIKKYQLFEKLNSRGSKSLIEQEFDQIIKDNCKNWTKAITPLYRGQIDMGDYIYMDPKGTYRKSIDDVNVHVEMLSNLPCWENWPKYGSSVIGISGDRRYASDYSDKVYEIVPFDNSEIVICPESTIWDSLGGFGDDGAIYLTYGLLEALNINSDIWVSTDDKTIEEQLKSIGKIVEFDHKKESMEGIRDYWGQKIEDFLSEMPNSQKFRDRNREDITGEDCFNFINEYLFNPIINDFRKEKYTPNFEVSKNKQIWISEPVLLISIDKV